jgi:hypothetical protein
MSISQLFLPFYSSSNSVLGPRAYEEKKRAYEWKTRVARKKLSHIVPATVRAKETLVKTIDRFIKLLLACDVPSRRLRRGVAKEKLDLFEFTIALTTNELISRQAFLDAVKAFGQPRSIEEHDQAFVPWGG